MLPKFKTVEDWERAQVLMQPCFIRVIDNLRKKLEDSLYQGTYQEVSEPIPGYRLVLSHQEQEIVIDIWQLCFQICCTDAQSEMVSIDPQLLEETGEVDWQKLEVKTQLIINQIFDNLPT